MIMNVNREEIQKMFDEHFIDECDEVFDASEEIIDFAIKAVKNCSLPSVIDCASVVIDDDSHGKFEMIACGRCKCGPITKEVNFCPKCGVKIGKRCR